MLCFHIATYAYLAWALAGSFAIYLWSRPSVRSLTGTLLLGALLAAIYGFEQGGPLLGTCPGFLGLGALGSLGLAALWSGPEQRQSSLDTCLAACLFPLFPIVAGFALPVAGISHLMTYDSFLYAFDAQLGQPPSFLVGQFLARFGALRQLCYFGYEALPLAMAIGFALERNRPRKNAGNIMLGFIMAAAGGFLLYNLYPAVGPVHVFGAQFPYSPPLAGSPPFGLIAVQTGPPRNAMPSVHMAIALLILWNSRLGPRLWRIVAAALLGITVLATLGFGEHYLVDLVVAVPFAVSVQGLATSAVPWRNRARVAAVATGALVALAWVAYLRLPCPPLAGKGALAWCLLCASASASLMLESRLNRAARVGRVGAMVNQGEHADSREARPIMRLCWRERGELHD